MKSQNKSEISLCFILKHSHTSLEHQSQLPPHARNMTTTGARSVYGSHVTDAPGRPVRA